MRPGQLEWVELRENTSIFSLARQFRQQFNSWAAIVGPHGSGKSTLLAHLVPQLAVLRYQAHAEETVILDNCATAKKPGAAVWHGLRRGKRPFRQILASRKFWQPEGLLVLDGLEQLRPWDALAVTALAGWSRMGVLATCHRPRKTLPTLIKTEATVELIGNLVTQLLQSAHDLGLEQPLELTYPFVDPGSLQTLLREEDGNVREVFMRLYDRYEELARILPISGPRCDL